MQVSVWPSLQHSLFSYTWSLLAQVWPLKTVEFATPVPVEPFSVDRIIRVKTIIAMCLMLSV